MTRDAEMFAPRLRATSLAVVLWGIAAICLITLALPHAKDFGEAEVLAGAAALAALGTVLWRFGAGFDRRQISAAVTVTTLVIALLNFAAGTTAGFGLLFGLTVVYAFYFLDLRFAIAHVGLVLVAYVTQLALNPGPSPVSRTLLVVGTPALTGLVVARLLRVLQGESGRARGVLETTSDAYAALELDGTVVEWNAAAERMFGLSRAETLGEPFGPRVLPGEGLAADRERLRALRDAEEVTGYAFETEYVRSDGSTFPAAVTVSRVEGGVGQPILACFIRDLSDERRRESEQAELVGEQAARREAEHVAEMVSGMQLLVDAALSHTTIEGMMHALIPRVRAVLEADAASVLLREEGEDVLVVRASTGGDPENRRRVEFGEYFSGIVAAEGHPKLEQDPDLEKLADPAMREAQVGSMMGVPLMVSGEVAGVLAVGARTRRFDSDDLGMLRLAADRVALALDHARIYEREHHIAETLQRSLLPEVMPNLPGMGVSARYVPAASEAEVGGDWFDVITMPGGRVGLVMGDVAGKGLSAASMVGSMRSALRAYALEGHDPAEVVERLNRLVWTELEESQMATLIYLVFEPLEGRFSWVNAGHLPPLRTSADGAGPEFLYGARSVPLGVMPFPTFEEGHGELDQGSTILLYTDGLVERPGTVIDAGLDALAHAVIGGPDKTEDLLDHLLEELSPDGGASDDVALLAFCNERVHDHFEIELPAQPESLASVRGLVRRWLRHAGSTETEIAEVTTACGEACTNAIEHAGAGGSSSFQIEGGLTDGPGVEVIVRDFGEWRPGRTDDQGRGLELMKALMDEVQVTPSPEGTVVRMQRRLDGVAS
ncbi:MAG TPA: SpoIIE family protein phosphatase [Thermoleophilaceae bacterium]|nr:SpoIIE family protein phosphatase [Thermoleophilaceae bacterium]